MKRVIKSKIFIFSLLFLFAFTFLITDFSPVYSASSIIIEDNNGDSTQDSTGSSATMNNNSSSEPTSAESATNIDLTETQTEEQIVFLDSSSVSEIAGAEINLPPDLLNELSDEYGGDITVNITSQDADSNQSSNTSLPDGYVLVDNQVFIIEILSGENGLNNFTNTYLISFDVIGLSDPENLSIGYFNSSQNKWVDIGGTLTDNTLWVMVDYTGIFGILRKSQEELDRDQEIANVFIEAALVNNSGVDLTSLLSYSGKIEDSNAESNGMDNYTNKLTNDVSSLLLEKVDAINNFIVYGTPLTMYLGAGERAGVVNSYKSAFNKLPDDEDEWADVIKIAIGRWPTERSQKAENLATSNFNRIYLRSPNRSQPNDNAAVTVMAYGLRPKNRNLDSEKAAIKIFKAIYGYSPVAAVDWDAVRAIAYSGAIR